MTLYASVSGSRAVTASLTMSTYGLWVADVMLADTAMVPAHCSLTIANLTLAGFTFRQAAFAGLRTVRLGGGAGGWRQSVRARAYQNPGGIKASTVLRDAATEVGESVVLASDTTIGTDFEREAAPAERVLRQLAGRQWWVDAAGVTHVGPRPATIVKSDFLVDQYDGGRGRFIISTEDVAAWMPGAQFTNALVPEGATVSSMSVAMRRNGKLRLEVLAT